MCEHHHHHHYCHPILCIIPPHMLDVIVMRGDAKAAKMAKSLIKLAERTRGERAEMPSPATVPNESMLAGVAAAGRNLVREIYDGGHKAALPGSLARGEGDAATGDTSVDEAYDGGGAVYDLYFDEYGRNSLDNNGMPLISTVHHRRKYNNAFWNGSQMAYGDGDGTIFQKFTELSVIGHEMSHGVVQFSGGLIYRDQSGALNESFADCMGALTVQRKQGQETSEASWLVGEGILGPEINGTALRNMKAPGTAYSDAVLGQDPQPYHMDFFVQTPNDNGGVHINSGIPNHAFYLFCQYLGGRAWERPGQIWYQALQELQNPLATFFDWATQTLQTANRLHGLGSSEALMLKRAWKLVGIQI